MSTPEIDQEKHGVPFSRIRFGFSIVFLIVCAGSVYRYLLIATFGPDTAMPVGDLARVLYVGMKFDLRLALLSVLPFFGLGWVSWFDPARTKQARTFWAVHFAMLSCMLMLIYVADLGYYDYLNIRLDAASIRFLENPLISAQMVWETYPVVPVLISLVVLGYSLFLGFRWLLSRSSAESRHPGRLVRASIIACVTVFYIAGIYGKFSYYPLRWSDAYFSPATSTAHATLNPVLNFVDTIATAEVGVWDEERLRSNYGHLAEYLGVERPDQSSLEFSRHVRPTPLVPGRPNVVLIMMESFAAHLTGFYGNPLQASPEFDRIAEQGLVFNRFYTPSVGTAHGVFTMLTGIPDVSLNRTASRNPKAIEQHIMLNEFDGYQKLYFLGGSANWANIRALLQHNIRDLQLYEEGSFGDSPRTDVWGISDLHLFEEANKVLSEIDEPFFAFIHLSGNHRPYTIPADNRGFAPAIIDDEAALENGFDLQDGYNSFRFMDHSLGFFMDTASKQEYFDNTLFILTADNGEIGKVPGPLHAEEETRVSYHHAPFVLFGPQMNRKPERMDSIGTQMDIMPTIAGAIGVPALNVTLGRNLLDPRNENGYGFIHRRLGSQSEVLVLDEDFLLSNRNGGWEPLVQLPGTSYASRQQPPDYDDRLASMIRYAESYYDASKRMLFGP